MSSTPTLGSRAPRSGAEPALASGAEEPGHGEVRAPMADRPPEGGERAGSMSQAAPAVEGDPPHGGAWIVRAPIGPPPDECACCGAQPVSSMKERSRDGREVIVPYCAACARHASAERTRRLVFPLGAGLVGAALGVALPWWLPLHVAGVDSTPLALLAAAAVPLVARGAPARWSPRPGHAASTLAAWWGADGALRVAALEAARGWAGAGAPPEPSAERAPEVPRWPYRLAALVAAALALTQAASGRAELRVVNTGEREVHVAVDGVRVATLPPERHEAPGAGATLAVRAGERQLRVTTSDGAVVDERRAHVAPREQHLYAPGSDTHCFWLEERGYGQRDDGLVRRRVLGGQAHFWRLGWVDGWFAPAPRGAREPKLSGGLRVVVRQAPCDAAPPDVVSHARGP